MVSIRWSIISRHTAVENAAYTYVEQLAYHLQRTSCSRLRSEPSSSLDRPIAIISTTSSDQPLPLMAIVPAHVRGCMRGHVPKERKYQKTAHALTWLKLLNRSSLTHHHGLCRARLSPLAVSISLYIYIYLYLSLSPPRLSLPLPSCPTLPPLPTS